LPEARPLRRCSATTRPSYLIVRPLIWSAAIVLVRTDRHSPVPAWLSAYTQQRLPWQVVDRDVFGKQGFPDDVDPDRHT
jgi:hypothetical protein